MTERELLTRRSARAGRRRVSVCSGQLYCAIPEILREKNKVMNLTAITDPTEIVTRHFSIARHFAPYMPQDGRVLDVGTGAGFPACRWRFCARRPSLCCSMHCASALIF